MSAVISPITTSGTTKINASVRRSRRICHRMRSAMMPTRFHMSVVPPSNLEPLGRLRIEPPREDQEGFFERLRAGERHDAFRRGLGDCAAGADHAEPVAAHCFIEVMRGDDERCALRGETGEIGPEAEAPFGIDADGWLVQQPKPGLVNER